jgi:protein tyrosine/serine phosphatase
MKTVFSQSSELFGTMLAMRWRGIAFMFVVVVLAIAASEVRESYAASDEKLALPGVANFGRISAHVYRGAQPTVDAYPSLKAIGIDTVVRLSTGEEFIAGERERVESLGMQFVSLPWRAADVPTDAQVRAFLDLFRAQPAHTIFVHCREGADRTGVMIALYRIAIDGFTAEQAVAEMKAFHYRYFFHPHLQDYVEAFPTFALTGQNQ